MTIVKFIVGQTYSTRSACDHNSIVRVQITKRTAKTVTGNLDGKIKTWRVREFDGSELFSPHGRYSMSPSLWANDTSDKQPDAGW